MIPETINTKALARLAPVKLPPTYHIDRSIGSGCYGDPPGFPSYYIQHIYTQHGNPPRRGAEAAIFGRVLYSSKDYDLPNADERRAKRLRGLWSPLPIDHPRTRAWMASRFQHLHTCYLHPTELENGRRKLVIYPVPSYELQTFHDVPRFNDEYRAAGVREANEFNSMVRAERQAIATLDNHAAVIAIREFYPDWTPTAFEANEILAGEVPANYPQERGNWWETATERPAPENCPGQYSMKHPTGGSWCQWCGWKASEAEPWPRKEADQHKASAKRCFKCETNGKHRLAIERESCSACVLRGYFSASFRADGNNPSDGPNYAGWARLYVEAGEPIPEKWRAAFEAERKSSNEAYAAALERSLAAFGVTFKA